MEKEIGRKETLGRDKDELKDCKRKLIEMNKSTRKRSLQNDVLVYLPASFTLCFISPKVNTRNTA